MIPFERRKELHELTQEQKKACHFAHTVQQELEEATTTTK